LLKSLGIRTVSYGKKHVYKELEIKGLHVSQHYAKIGRSLTEEAEQVFGAIELRWRLGSMCLHQRVILMVVTK